MCVYLIHTFEYIDMSDMMCSKIMAALLKEFKHIIFHQTFFNKQIVLLINEHISETQHAKYD